MYRESEGSKKLMPSFKTRPTRHHIDRAPTSRALCRWCRLPIQKGNQRLVSVVFVRPARSTARFHCLGCAFRPEVRSSLKASVVAALREAVTRESYGFPPSDTVAETRMQRDEDTILSYLSLAKRPVPSVMETLKQQSILQ